MDDTNNNISILKYVYDETNNSDFIDHAFEIYFPKIFKYIIDNYSDLHIDIGKIIMKF